MAYKCAGYNDNGDGCGITSKITIRPAQRFLYVGVLGVNSEANGPTTGGECRASMLLSIFCCSICELNKPTSCAEPILR